MIQSWQYFYQIQFKQGITFEEHWEDMEWQLAENLEWLQSILVFVQTRKRTFKNI